MEALKNYMSLGWSDDFLVTELTAAPKLTIPSPCFMIFQLCHLTNHILSLSQLFESKKLCGSKFLNVIMHNMKKFLFSFDINCLPDHFISCASVCLLNSE